MSCPRSTSSFCAGGADGAPDSLDLSSHEVTAYHRGKEKLLIYFVGEVMRETRGKADPKLVNELLKLELEARRGV